MGTFILIAAGLSWASGATAADTAQCDAKPFTLNKPKPTATQKPIGIAKAKPAAKAAPNTGTSQAQAKPFADCKEPKKG